MDEQIRQVFQNRIQKGLHGPGSDTWGLPDSEEVLSDYPLIRYFTGIVFPDKSICSRKRRIHQLQHHRQGAVGGICRRAANLLSQLPDEIHKEGLFINEKCLRQYPLQGEDRGQSRSGAWHLQ